MLDPPPYRDWVPMDNRNKDGEISMYGIFHGSAGGRLNSTGLLYDIGWRICGPFLAVAGLFSPKLARAIAGRRESVEEFRKWAGERRIGPDVRPLLVLHGASAGELAGSIPVLSELRRLIPELELVVTYSSPSGEAAAADIRPDMHWFVPFDRRDHARAVLDALRPDALVFAKLDLWPTFTSEAARRNIPVGMINATVRPGSGRLRFPARQLLRTAYGQMEAVGAVSEGERERLVRLGVHPAAIQITGDGSFDRAIHRVRSAEGRPARLPERVAGMLRLVAGSTWPSDEALLLETLALMPEVELVLVPHEPTPEKIARLEEDVMRHFGTPARVWSRIPAAGKESSDSSPLIIDAVGFLAELYTEADVAYVGGGLDGTGLHSVIEPAAAGVPVMFGARHDRWEAHELVAAGGAVELDGSNAVAEIASLCDADRRASMGTAGRDYVAAKAGAGRAGADLIASLLNRC